MSFKIPCGGFKLDEKSFSLDENGVLSIPKPLTYDYMPEGYPSKGIEYVTLMEEQEVTFSDKGGGIMGAVSPVALAIEPRDKLTVVWDGVSYDVVAKRIAAGPEVVYLVFGNIGLAGLEGATDHPFLYVDEGNGVRQWYTTDTATSHTIKVMLQQVTITPMSADFIPKNFNVVFSGINSSIPTSCNVTYDELRGWIENSTTVFAIYEVKDNDGSVVNVTNIMKFLANADSLTVYYGSGSNFTYNSDGTISESGVES